MCRLFVPLPLLPLCHAPCLVEILLELGRLRTVPTLAAERLSIRPSVATVRSVAWQHPTSWGQGTSARIYLLVTFLLSGISQNLPVEPVGSGLCPARVGCSSFLSPCQGLGVFLLPQGLAALGVLLGGTLEPLRRVG